MGDDMGQVCWYGGWYGWGVRYGPISAHLTHIAHPGVLIWGTIWVGCAIWAHISTPHPYSTPKPYHPSYQHTWRCAIWVGGAIWAHIAHPTHIILHISTPNPYQHTPAISSPISAHPIHIIPQILRKNVKIGVLSSKSTVPAGNLDLDK